MVEFLGFKKTYIPTIKAKRNIGKSGYNFLKCSSLALNIMVSTSNKLLLVPIITSTILFLISFIYAFIQLFNIIFKNNLFASEYNLLIFLFLFVTSVLFLNISILGIYIGIILKEILKKPHYIVSYIKGTK